MAIFAGRVSRVDAAFLLSKSFLIGDGVIGVFESALLELDVSDYHLICVNAPFDHAVDPRDPIRARISRFFQNAR